MSTNPEEPCNSDRYICAGTNGMYAGTIQEQVDMITVALSGDHCPVDGTESDIYPDNSFVFIGGWFRFEPDVSSCGSNFQSDAYSVTFKNI